MGTGSQRRRNMTGPSIQGNAGTNVKLTGTIYAKWANFKLSGGGVYDHPRGLVDDDDLFVLIDDVERNIFGLDLRGGRLGKLCLDVLARVKLV